MNDHNLDDLIIGEPEPSGGSSKSLLSLIALIFIILIVGVLLAKLLFSEPEAVENNATSLTGMVRPKTPEKTPPPEAKLDETIPDELQPLGEESLPASDELRPIRPAAKSEPVRRPPRQELREKKPSPARIRPKPRPRKKPAELFEKHPKNPTGKKAATTKKTYFIQVGSFKRMPERKFLDKMRSVGYEPLIIKTGRMIKVRIGPYESYGDAKAKLPEVKEKLGIDGFVVRKK